jgi:TRAP-type C4-dicarboxylate transport system permease large subunit
VSLCKISAIAGYRESFERGSRQLTKLVTTLIQQSKFVLILNLLLFLVSGMFQEDASHILLVKKV